MLRLLLRLRILLPSSFVERFLELHWETFWRHEQAEEERELQTTAKVPLRGSERPTFIEEIARCYPFTSALEVGCGYAQNFHILARQYPNCRFVGVDIDAERVQSGNALFEKKGMKNVTLVEGSVLDLSDFPDDCVDVVLCCALLLFVAPAEVEQAVSEMIRVAKRSIVILEQHRVDESQPKEVADLYAPRDTGRSAYYLRDYRALFERFLPSDQISEVPVSHSRWVIEQWDKYATVFRIDLTPTRWRK